MTDKKNQQYFGKISGSNNNENTYSFFLHIYITYYTYRKFVAQINFKI